MCHFQVTEAHRDPSSMEPNSGGPLACVCVCVRALADCRLPPAVSLPQKGKEKKDFGKEYKDYGKVLKDYGKFKKCHGKKKADES